MTSKLVKHGRRAAIVGVTVIAVTGVGVSYAAWTSTVGGAGGAASGTLQPLEVSVGSAAATQLYPGATTAATAGDLTLSVKNPNAFPVQVTLAQDTSSGKWVYTSNDDKTATQQSTCSDIPANHPVSPATAPTNPTGISLRSGASLTFTANASTSGSPQTVSLPQAVSMATTSANGCQGKTFVIPLTVTTQVG